MTDKLKDRKVCYVCAGTPRRAPCVICDPEPAVEAAEIEVRGYLLSCAVGGDGIDICRQDLIEVQQRYGGEILELMTVAQHRRILAGVNQQAGSGVLFSKGFTTLETGDDKYRIVTSYQNRDDAWSDYMAISGAAPLPPSPAAKAGA